MDCRAKAVNEEMKRAATYAIAALAKRPIMKRRTPSAGDLIHLAAAAQQPAVAAMTSDPSSSSSTLSTDMSAAACNGSAGSCGSDRSSSPQKQNGIAGSKAHHKHAGSGGKHIGHARRKSYGENCFYTTTDVEGSDQPKFGRQ